jgi:glycosyltransferase involved in cell wall biosynthesis
VQPEPTGCNDTFPRKFDFVYVASGEPHKNHGNLLEAWRLLAEAGQRPSLALTLDANAFPDLSAYITQYAAQFSLDVVNLGCLPAGHIAALYGTARALIYPSTTESLGLPLIEASQRGLPVLAPELDYVRDVVAPVETFDANSPTSIARAVRRFLGVSEPLARMGTAEHFLAEAYR